MLPKSQETVHPIVRTPEEWRVALTRLGERPFRAQQVFQWIHRKNTLDPALMSDLPEGLRSQLGQDGLGEVLDVQIVRRSNDGTRKLVVRFADAATVETVLIPAVSGPGSIGRDAAEARLESAAATTSQVHAAGRQISEDVDPDTIDDEPEEGETETIGTTRVTQCISTQVGCAMGCVFCASGVAGLKRHLGAHEIVAQVIAGRALLEPGEALRNVVLMGMGEPLHNYDQTARALAMLIRQDGIGLSSRRVTVSTSGLIPEIDQLGKDFNGQITLAISLHATTNERRSALMPINKKYPLAELMACLRRYPMAKRRRITIEYTLVSGQNDTLDESKRLAKLLRDLPCKINLIPMNPIEASTLGPPNFERVLAFQRVLLDSGYACFIRRQRGEDVDAACGQLALLGQKPRPKRPFASA